MSNITYSHRPVVTMAIIMSLMGCGIEHAHETCQHDHGTSTKVTHAHADSNALAHGDEGPHGGHLIELGRNHDYHAELVEVAATQSVVVYILDSQMQEVPIDHDTIAINLAIDNRASTSMLKAAEGETADGFSRFVSEDEVVYLALHRQDNVNGKLRVTIKGMPYVGRLAHRAHAHSGRHQH